MKQYSGRVIGGHHAGEFHTVESPYLKLAIPTNVSPFAPIGPAEIPDNIGSIVANTEEYKHCEIHWRNDKIGETWKFEFWVPWKIKEPQPFILEELIKGYIENANRNDRRRNPRMR